MVLPDSLGEGDHVYGYSIKKWKGPFDAVRGYVEEVMKGEDGTITGVRVLNTSVMINEDTKIN